MFTTPPSSSLPAGYGWLSGFGGGRLSAFLGYVFGRIGWRIHTVKRGDHDVVERSGLTLTLRDRFYNACIGVKGEKGVGGGCGADFAEPLNIGAGAIDGVSFVYGWTLGITAKVVVTLANGTEVEVTDLIPVEGLYVLLFLELIPPTADGEPELSITAVALDRSGEIIAEFALSGPDAPKT